MGYARTERPLRLDGFAAASQFFAGCMADSDPSLEGIWVAHVDEQARCLHVTRHEGHETGAHFPLKQIIRDAAMLGSAGILLAHNHPGGDATPSDSDCRATRRLASAAEALDCAVVDHLIFAGEECTSFRRMGLL
jgi:DNA repair protein RadC